MGMVVLFWLLSKAITPWTGLLSWERSFPELGMRLADPQLHASSAWVIGSSSVMHHFVPEILDSLTDLNWYTCGFQRAAPPESFQLAHLLLDEVGTQHLELLVFEVQPEEPLSWEEVASLRHAAQLDELEALRRIRRLPWADVDAGNFEQVKVLLWGWVQHVVSFVRPSQYLASRPPAVDPKPEKGFVALKTNDWETGRLSASHAAWLAHSDSMMAHQVMIAQDFDLRMNLQDPAVNWDCEGRVEPILAQMETLRARCADRGIRCVFHFQKLWDTNGCLYLAAHERWGAGEVIETMGYAQLEDLFDPRDRYDEAHFLRSGAERFSRHFARRLNAAMNTRQQTTN